jgi:hypothetical protein
MSKFIQILITLSILPEVLPYYTARRTTGSPRGVLLKILHGARLPLVSRSA